MNYDDKLKSLLRERELAARKIPDPRLTDGPDKVRFWRKILSILPEAEQRTTKRKFGNLLLNAIYPPPRSDEEQRISDQNRTIEKIEAEIAAIPPATVVCRDHAPDDLPAMEGRAIVLFGLRKEPSRYSYEPRPRANHHIRSEYHPAARQGLAEALRMVTANRQTELTIKEDMRRFPCRSRAKFSEVQNHDPGIRADVDGRHFSLNLTLSKPLFAALLELLPEPDERSRYSSSSCHVVYVPIDQDDTPRDVPYHDAKPCIEFPETRLTRLHVAKLSSFAEDAELLKVISLTESD